MRRVKAEPLRALMNPAYTERQGQFLAYIHAYSLLNGCAPAEADMQQFFRITPPSVHSMVLTLERRGLIRRVPGQARSITLAIPPEALPPLKRP
jgi:DNA-binding MarR family transcriptional regulator